MKQFLPGGRGYSKIKRAPAYSFGLSLPTTLSKPAAKPNAPIFNVSGFTCKGIFFTHTYVAYLAESSFVRNRLCCAIILK